MNTFKYYALLMPLALSLAFLSSCSSDDDKTQPSDEKEPSSGDVTSFDQVKYLQDNIIETDSLGNIVQRVIGAKLNSADTTELTVGAEDIASAKQMFESWLSPDTKTETISPSTVNMKADLKDANGNVQETVYFKEVNNDGNTVAEVTFEKGGVLKHFSKIKFLSKWTVLNDHSQYNVGDCVPFETYSAGTRNWVCIRNAKNGVSGLLVFINSAKGRWAVQNIGNFASVSMAQTVSSILRSNNNWDTFVEFFNQAGIQLEKDEYYWTSEWSYYVLFVKQYAIRLGDGDVDWFSIGYPWDDPRHPYIQVRTFGMESD